MTDEKTTRKQDACATIFRPEEWMVLADALREHGGQCEVSKVKETGFGPRYEAEGERLCPDGRWQKAAVSTGRPRSSSVSWSVKKSFK